MIPLPANGLAPLVELIIVRLVNSKDSFNSLQFLNASSPIVVMYSSEISVRATQSENADAPTVTFLEIDTVASFEQPENAPVGMADNVSPNDTAVKEVHPAKTLSQSVLTLGRNTDVIPLPANGLAPLVELIVMRFENTKDFVRELQFLNASSPILVMYPSDIAESDVQPENTPVPIVTFVPRVTVSNFVQPLKALFPMEFLPEQL